MTTELKLPEFAESMTSATVTMWLKQPGDRVSAGDAIVEVDTDKTTVEIEAPVSGVLREVVVGAGTDVEVGAVLAVIDDDEVEGDVAVEISPEVETTAADEAPAEVVEPVSQLIISAEPVAQSPAVQPPDPEPPISSNVGADVIPEVDATPLARNMAAAAGLDLAGVAGSGQSGRIEKRDVDRALSRKAKLPAYTESSLSTMRRVTAKRMAESKRTIPHFYLSAECDMTDIVDRRRRHNAQENHVTITAVVVRAAALALQKVPAANAVWHGDRVRMYAASNVAVAVNTSGGLVAPVIRDANQKRLDAISSELRELSERARDGRLNPDEYTGGTFTISNLGMFEVTSLYAIVNPPQSCILGVGAVTSRPVVRDGSIEIGQLATLTLSADHRVIDGAIGGELLKEIRRLIESPASLFD